MQFAVIRGAYGRAVIGVSSESGREEGRVVGVVFSVEGRFVSDDHNSTVGIFGGLKYKGGFCFLGG